MNQQTKRDKVDLHEIFLGLQGQMAARLSTNRGAILHSGTKGDATELQWLEMLNGYLPQRYRADKAFVLDHEGQLSEQLDVVIYDRQYSPFLFNQDNAKYVPAESVYGVFEVKQELNAEYVRHAQQKAASVRRLIRTSAPIPHAGGTYPPKEPPRILAGILTLDAEWNPPFGDPFLRAFETSDTAKQLDLGCVLRWGGFEVRYRPEVPAEIITGSKDTALIFFFLKLLGRLQESATVVALDFSIYGKAL